MAVLVRYDKCLCCGSAAISKVFECKDHTVSGEFFEIWHCSTCTFRFTQNAPAEEAIASYYKSEQYVSHSDTRKGLINKLYHSVRIHTLKKKRKLVRDITGLRHGALLDIGAGTGAFVEAMRNGGWSVTGLEPDEVARANALRSYDLQLRDLSELHEMTSNSFDAITMWHVFEHVHAATDYLTAIHKILKDSGKLIIAVPNYTSYDAQVYERYWAAYDVPRHLFHFSPNSLRKLVSSHGFEVEHVKPMWFDSYYVSMLSEKYKHGKDNLPGAVWTGLISNLKAFSATERCSSVIYIIKKRV